MSKAIRFWAFVALVVVAFVILYPLLSAWYWFLDIRDWLRTPPLPPAFDHEGGSPELPALTAEPPQAYPAEPARQKELREAYNARRDRPSWYPASVREFAEAKQGGRHG